MIIYCHINFVFTQEKPDLWVEPWNSKIIQIRAAEIVASDK